MSRGSCVHFPIGLRRLVSLWVLICFPFSGLSSAAPLPDAEPVPAAAPSTIRIPGALGQIESQYFAGADKPYVFFVQDAHSVLDAQRNIRRLIEYLEKEYGVRAVGIEGGEGKLDPLIFRAFPDAFVKEKVMEDYLLRGELTGAGAAAIFSSSQSVYFGIEDWKLYGDNYRAYLSSVSERAGILSLLDKVKTSLDEKQAKIFSPELTAHQKKTADFYSENTHLLEYLQHLRQLAESLDPGSADETGALYPHLAVLWETVARDRAAPSLTLDASLRRMAKAFQEHYLPKLDRRTQMEFNGAHQQFLSGQLDAGKFLRVLVETGKNAGIQPKLTPEMKDLLGHTERLSQIKGTRLFDELEALSTRLENKLIQNPMQRMLADDYRRVRRLTSLAKLELSREQLDQYQADAEGHLALMDKNSARESLAPALTFYRLALERDRVFHEKLEAVMKKENARSAAVLAGGFHAQGFEEELRSKGYSYAVITPKIDSLEGSSLYEGVMAGKLSYGKDVTRSLYDAFVRHASASLMQELSEPEFRKMIKLWRDEVIRLLAAEKRISEAGEYTRALDALSAVYLKKFGPGAGSKTLPEVLAELDKELADFKARSLEGLWTRFENGMEKFFSSPAPVPGAALGTTVMQQIRTSLPANDPLLVAITEGPEAVRPLNVSASELPVIAASTQQIQVALSDLLPVSSQGVVNLPEVLELRSQLRLAAQAGDQLGAEANTNRAELARVLESRVDEIVRGLPQSQRSQQGDAALRAAIIESLRQDFPFEKSGAVSEAAEVKSSAKTPESVNVQVSGRSELRAEEIAFDPDDEYIMEVDETALAERAREFVRRDTGGMLWSQYEGTVSALRGFTEDLSALSDFIAAQGEAGLESLRQTGVEISAVSADTPGAVESVQTAILNFLSAPEKAAEAVIRLAMAQEAIEDSELAGLSVLDLAWYFANRQNLDFDPAAVQTAIENIQKDPSSIENWNLLSKALSRNGQQASLTQAQVSAVMNAYGASNFKVIPKEVKPRTDPEVSRQDAAVALFQSAKSATAAMSLREKILMSIGERLSRMLTDTVSGPELAESLGAWAQARLQSAVPGPSAAPLLQNDGLSEALKEAPSLAGLLTDASKAKALLEILTALRVVLDETKTERNNFSIPLGAGISVRVDSGSYRRFILQETRSGKTTAFEVKVPGELRHKLEVSTQDFVVSEAMQRNPLLAGMVQKTLGVFEYPAGEYTFYGMKVDSSQEDAPVRIVISEYPIEQHASRSRLNNFISSRKNSLTVDQAREISRQVARIAFEGITAAGWTGHRDLVHFQNFSIVEHADGRLEVQLVNDLEGFKLIENEADQQAVVRTYQEFRKIVEKLPGSIENAQILEEAYEKALASRTDGRSELRTDGEVELLPTLEQWGQMSLWEQWPDQNLGDRYAATPEYVRLDGVFYILRGEGYDQALAKAREQIVQRGKDEKIVVLLEGKQFRGGLTFKHHFHTTLSLVQLANVAPSLLNQTLIDLGAGSGVLGITALLRDGARNVLAVDLDAESLAQAQEALALTEQANELPPGSLSSKFISFPVSYEQFGQNITENNFAVLRSEVSAQPVIITNNHRPWGVTELFYENLGGWLLEDNAARGLPQPSHIIVAGASYEAGTDYEDRSMERMEEVSKSAYREARLPDWRFMPRVLKDYLSKDLWTDYVGATYQSPQFAAELQERLSAERSELRSSERQAVLDLFDASVRSQVLPESLPQDYLVLAPILVKTAQEVTDLADVLMRSREGGYLGRTIFVDDGSAPELQEQMSALREQFPDFHYIQFDRNQQKEVALYAAIDRLRNEYQNRGLVFPSHFASVDADSAFSAPSGVIAETAQNLNQAVENLRSNPRIGAVGIEIKGALTPGKSGFIEWLQAMNYYITMKLGKVIAFILNPSIPGGGVIYSTAAFEKAVEDTVGKEKTWSYLSGPMKLRTGIAAQGLKIGAPYSGVTVKTKIFSSLRQLIDQQQRWWKVSDFPAVLNIVVGVLGITLAVMVIQAAMTIGLLPIAAAIGSIAGTYTAVTAGFTALWAVQHWLRGDRDQVGVLDLLLIPAYITVFFFVIPTALLSRMLTGFPAASVSVPSVQTDSPDTSAPSARSELRTAETVESKLEKISEKAPVQLSITRPGILGRLISRFQTIREIPEKIPAVAVTAEGFRLLSADPSTGALQEGALVPGTQAAAAALARAGVRWMMGDKLRNRQFVNSVGSSAFESAEEASRFLRAHRIHQFQTSDFVFVRDPGMTDAQQEKLFEIARKDLDSMLGGDSSLKAATAAFVPLMASYLQNLLAGNYENMPRTLSHQFSYSPDGIYNHLERDKRQGVAAPGAYKAIHFISLIQQYSNQLNEAAGSRIPGRILAADIDLMLASYYTPEFTHGFLDALFELQKGFAHKDAQSVLLKNLISILKGTHHVWMLSDSYGAVEENVNRGLFNLQQGLTYSSDLKNFLSLYNRLTSHNLTADDKTYKFESAQFLSETESEAEFQGKNESFKVNYRSEDGTRQSVLMKNVSVGAVRNDQFATGVTRLLKLPTYRVSIAQKVGEDPNSDAVWEMVQMRPSYTLGVSNRFSGYQPENLDKLFSGSAEQSAARLQQIGAIFAVEYFGARDSKMKHILVDENTGEPFRIDWEFMFFNDETRPAGMTAKLSDIPHVLAGDERDFLRAILNGEQGLERLQEVIRGFDRTLARMMNDLNKGESQSAILQLVNSVYRDDPRLSAIKQYIQDQFYKADGTPRTIEEIRAMIGLSPTAVANPLFRRSELRSESQDDLARIRVKSEALRVQFESELEALKPKTPEEYAAFTGRYTELLDRTLAGVFALYEPTGLTNQISLMVTGSLARRSPAYGTDIDVVILANDQQAPAKAVVEHFVDTLERVITEGVDFPTRILPLSRPVYTPDINQLLADLEELDVISLRNLLDSRQIAGNQAVYQRFQTDVLPEVISSLESWIALDAHPGAASDLRFAWRFGDRILEDELSESQFLRALEKLTDTDLYSEEQIDTIRNLVMDQNSSYVDLLSRSSFYFHYLEHASSAAEIFDWTSFNAKQGLLGSRTLNHLVSFGRVITDLTSWNLDGKERRELFEGLVKSGFLTDKEVADLTEIERFNNALKTAVNLSWEDAYPGEALIESHKDTLNDEIIPDAAARLGFTREQLKAQVESHAGRLRAIVRSKVEAYREQHSGRSELRQTTGPFFNEDEIELSFDDEIINPLNIAEQREILRGAAEEIENKAKVTLMGHGTGSATTAILLKILAAGKLEHYKGDIQYASLKFLNSAYGPQDRGGNGIFVFESRDLFRMDSIYTEGELVGKSKSLDDALVFVVASENLPEVREALMLSGQGHLSNKVMSYQSAAKYLKERYLTQDSAEELPFAVPIDEDEFMDSLRASDITDVLSFEEISQLPFAEPFDEKAERDGPGEESGRSELRHQLEKEMPGALDARKETVNLPFDFTGSVESLRESILNSPAVIFKTLKKFESVSQKAGRRVINSDGSLSAVVDVKGQRPALYIGDLHGRMDAFLAILNDTVSLPQGEMKVLDALMQGLINLYQVGDIVHPAKDYSNPEAQLQSFALFIAFLSLKNAMPENVHMISGNHESALRSGKSVARAPSKDEEPVNLDVAFKSAVLSKAGRPGGWESVKVLLPNVGKADVIADEELGDLLYKRFLSAVKSLPVMIRDGGASGAVGVVHAGPPTQTGVTREDLDLAGQNTRDGSLFDQLQWTRTADKDGPKSIAELDAFGQSQELSLLINGHTPLQNFRADKGSLVEVYKDGDSPIFGVLHGTRGTRQIVLDASVIRGEKFGYLFLDSKAGIGKDLNTLKAPGGTSAFRVLDLKTPGPSKGFSLPASQTPAPITPARPQAEKKKSAQTVPAEISREPRIFNAGSFYFRIQLEGETLVILEADQNGTIIRERARKILRDTESLVIGRDPEMGADLLLSENNNVSRVHAFIRLNKGVYTIEDRGLSRNGTFADRIRIEAEPLRFTDKVGIVQDRGVRQTVYATGTDFVEAPRDIRGHVNPAAVLVPKNVPTGQALVQEIRAYIEQYIRDENQKKWALQNLDNPVILALLLPYMEAARRANILFVVSQKIENAFIFKVAIKPSLDIISEVFEALPKELLWEMTAPQGYEFTETDRHVLGYQKMDDTVAGGAIGKFSDKKQAMETIVHEILGHKRHNTKAMKFEFSADGRQVRRLEGPDQWQIIVSGLDWLRIALVNKVERVTPFTPELREAIAQGHTIAFGAQALDVNNLPNMPAQEVLNLMRNLFLHAFAYYSDLREVLAFTAMGDDLAKKQAGKERNKDADYAATRLLLLESSSRVHSVPVDPVNGVYISYEYNPDTQKFDTAYLQNLGSEESPDWHKVLWHMTENRWIPFQATAPESLRAALEVPDALPVESEAAEEVLPDAQKAAETYSEISSELFTIGETEFRLGRNPNELYIVRNRKGGLETLGPLSLTLGTVIKIGREPGNQVVFDDAKASRFHAEISVDWNGNVTIVDKESTNGISVNGVKQKKYTVVWSPANEIKAEQEGFDELSEGLAISEEEAELIEERQRAQQEADRIKAEQEARNAAAAKAAKPAEEYLKEHLAQNLDAALVLESFFDRKILAAADGKKPDFADLIERRDASNLIIQRPFGEADVVAAFRPYFVAILRIFSEETNASVKARVYENARTLTGFFSAFSPVENSLKIGLLVELARYSFKGDQAFKKSGSHQFLAGFYAKSRWGGSLAEAVLSAKLDRLIESRFTARSELRLTETSESKLPLNAVLYLNEEDIRMLSSIQAGIQQDISALKKEVSERSALARVSVENAVDAFISDVTDLLRQEPGVEALVSRSSRADFENDLNALLEKSALAQGLTREASGLLTRELIPQTAGLIRSVLTAAVMTGEVRALTSSGRISVILTPEARAFLSAGNRADFEAAFAELRAAGRTDLPAQFFLPAEAGARESWFIQSSFMRSENEAGLSTVQKQLESFLSAKNVPLTFGYTAGTPEERLARELARMFAGTLTVGRRFGEEFRTSKMGYHVNQADRIVFVLNAESGRIQDPSTETSRKSRGIVGQEDFISPDLLNHKEYLLLADLIVQSPYLYGQLKSKDGFSFGVMDEEVLNGFLGFLNDLAQTSAAEAAVRASA